MFKKILYLLIITIILISPVSSIDNTKTTPTCINPSYDTGYVFITTENDATNGNVTSSAITTGYLSPSNVRINNGVNILCAASDPTTAGSLPTISRIFGTSEDGSVWYVDNNNNNYSEGFYTPDTPSNPLKLINSLSASTSNRKLAIDSSGNVYTNDGNEIYKHIKSLDYSPQLFYTIAANTDYRAATGAGATKTVHIIGLKTDSSDNLHVLIGTMVSGISGSNQGYLSYTKISSSGAHISSNISLRCDGTSAGAPAGVEGCTTGSVTSAGFQSGGLIIDSDLENYTYSGYGIQQGGILRHQNTTTSTSIATLTGITSVSDIGYNNFQIYVASPLQNLIRSYATNFEGYTQTSTIEEGVLANDYSTASVSSLYDNYYNNSDVFINYYVAVDTTAIISSYDPDTYRWKIVLIDPSDVAVHQEFSNNCEFDFLADNCIASGTLKFTPPVTNWTNGTWTVNLYEYNTDTFALALLDTDTYNVYNNSTVALPEPTETLESGTGSTTLSQIDGWVGLLGLGVNSISKFLFAMLLILSVTFFGFIATKGSGMGGAISGALPFTFFVFIEFIPVWTIIIVVMVVAIKTGWFR